jgi:hypothetical protein
VLSVLAKFFETFLFWHGQSISPQKQRLFEIFISRTGLFSAKLAQLFRIRRIDD